jgi:hypothetical protein
MERSRIMLGVAPYVWGVAVDIVVTRRRHDVLLCEALVVNLRRSATESINPRTVSVSREALRRLGALDAEAIRVEGEDVVLGDARSPVAERKMSWGEEDLRFAARLKDAVLFLRESSLRHPEAVREALESGESDAVQLGRLERLSIMRLAWYAEEAGAESVLLNCISSDGCIGYRDGHSPPSRFADMRAMMREECSSGCGDVGPLEDAAHGLIISLMDAADEIRDAGSWGDAWGERYDGLARVVWIALHSPGGRSVWSPGAIGRVGQVDFVEPCGEVWRGIERCVRALERQAPTRTGERLAKIGPHVLPDVYGRPAEPLEESSEMAFQELLNGFNWADSMVGIPLDDPALGGASRDGVCVVELPSPRKWGVGRILTFTPVVSGAW